MKNDECGLVNAETPASVNFPIVAAYKHRGAVTLREKCHTTIMQALAPSVDAYAKKKARESAERVEAIRLGWNRWKKQYRPDSHVRIRVMNLLWWFCPASVPDYPRGRWNLAEELAAASVPDVKVEAALLKIGLSPKEARLRSMSARTTRYSVTAAVAS